MSIQTQPPPPKRPRYGLRVLFICLGATVVLIIGIGILSALAGPSQEHGKTAGQHVAAATPPVAPAPSPSYSAPPPSPDAQGKWHPNAACDVSLSPNLDGNDFLVASIHLHNTGNIGARVRVRASWPQNGFPAITRQKTVRLPWQSSRDVSLRVSTAGAATDEIGNFQDVQLGSSKMDVCHYNVKIVGTFGQAH